MVFITDAKMDDILAWALLLKAIDGHMHYIRVVHCIITDIQDQEGARMVLEKIASDVLVSGCVQVKFYRGTRSFEAKKHEAGMFSVYGKWTHNHAGWHDVDVLVGVETVFVFAPFNGLEEIVYTAEVTYISYGYNSRASMCTLEDFKRMSGLRIMNNCSETVYPAINGKRQEGGRFKQDDDELWEAVWKLAPSAKALKEGALLDSKKFALKYMQRAFDFANIDFKLTMENLMTPEAQELAKTLDVDILPAYMYRSLDQVLRGVLDIECSDFQHLALWMTKPFSKVMLVDLGKPYLEIERFTLDKSFPKTAATALCPVGLTVDSMRANVLSLVRSLNEGNSCEIIDFLVH